MISLVRSVFYLGAVVSLLLSFAQAPFQHTHKSDPRHLHAKGFGHAHWSTSSTHGLAWEADNNDSDARMLNWLAGDGRAAAKFAVALPESLALAQVVFAVQGARIPDLTPGNHDPPRPLALGPRAPPA